jgi:drug/metabolite transporter (DMT)-like permease
VTAESHRLRVAAATAAALCAFAANSILCRLALRGGSVDAATFTFLRLAAGAAMLVPLAGVLRSRAASGSDPAASPGGGAEPRPWRSALYLFAYAAAFSFAYVSLDAGVGALLLFAAVQTTMIAAAHRAGERMRLMEGIGLAAALAGIAALTSPGARAPAPLGSLLMIAAGTAWGLYTLGGRRSAGGTPLGATAWNFAAAVPLAAALSIAALAAGRPALHLTAEGAILAVVSGAATSGLGYVVWYAALRGLRPVRAAIVQLAVPALAAAGGVVWLGERISLRLIVSGLLILGGVALALTARPPAEVDKPRTRVYL